ncbi:MAG: cyclic nucleotide-binding domain-containing protein, partial [Anaerolineaceae bacterium]|nr:cyclic nucleotide-binding domain-containing protein [Anaerolineaceae bacterium]
MPADRTTLIGMLKRIHLFQGLDDDKLGVAVDLLEQVQIPAGELIYKEDDPADYFYIIIEGKVQTSRYNPRMGQDQQLNELGDDDYFGEEVLENSWPRQIRVETISDSDLVRISVPNFIAMLESLPVLAKRLQMILDCYRLKLKTHFNWLNPGETVYFVARRHQVFLIIMILPPIFILAFAIMVFGFWYLSAPMLSNLFLLALSVPAALGWLVWNYIDWTNDYYIVTNQRIVYQERVVLLYDSRQESPLEVVQSTTINTSQWGRWLGYGNVAIRTYIGTILFRNLPYPEQVQAVVQEYQLRSQYHETHTEIKRIKTMIDKRIRQGPDQPALPKGFKPPPQPDPMRIFLSSMFHLRYEVGGTVIFRTHWFILLQKIFFPTLLLIGLITIFIYSALNQFALLSLQSTCGVIFLFGIMVFAWWFYQYIDWHNDVYLITPDQVVDVNKKPLGREERQAAPMKNILSIEYKRLGILGLLLNFGTVYIRVGDQTLTFDNVLNPSEVQRELFHRLAKKNYEEKVKQNDSDRKQMAEWIATYNDWAKEN